MFHVKAGSVQCACDAGKASLFILIFSILWIGCQDYVFDPVLPSITTAVSKEVHIPTVSNVDILFVVDDSRSMTGNQDNLARNLDVLIRLLEERNTQRELDGMRPMDFQIGIASTSILYRAIGMKEFGELEDKRYYDLVGRENCMDGTAYDISHGDPYPEGQLMAAGNNRKILTSAFFRENKNEALKQFRENIRLGTCGSSQEQGFEAMRRVLENNPEFFREQSRLVVVFLSDEEDCSDITDTFVSYIYQGAHADPPVIDTRLHPEYNHALTPVDYYKRYLDDLAYDRRGSVAIAAIVSAEGDPPHDMYPGLCFDEVCAAECDRTREEEIRHAPCWCGGHTPGGRYLELAGMYSTNNHITGSICQSDFSDTLAELVRIAEVKQCIDLPARPQNDDTNLVLIRIERDGLENPIVCRPPASPGIQACDAGADWWYHDKNSTVPQLCLCEESECYLREGDRYRLSIVEEACSSESPCD